MSQELRKVIEAAQYAESQAIEALQNGQIPHVEFLLAVEALKACTKEIGWRYKEVAALIAERDAMAQQDRGREG